jgi:uncharacterized protein YbjT (DUF2867 family)
MGEVIAVLGATGRTGGATARHLLSRGATVRAIVRDTESDAARTLSSAGADVVAANMDDPASVRPALMGAARLFNVQPAFDSRGRYHLDAELKQGIAVAEAAKDAGVRHIMQLGAGNGKETGVAHLDSKNRIRETFEGNGLVVTYLSPAPFMELMVDPGFMPALSTFGAEPRVVGWDRPMPWVACDDIGRIAAERLTSPVPEQGEMIEPVGDVRSLRECHSLLAAAGRAPRRFPMPVFVFRKMVGEEFPAMWRWITEEYEGATPDPRLMDVPAWIATLERASTVPQRGQT